ncbi:hypothetical protein OESDEN_05306 [Oesophagostomum dentatum]|uniref:Uncharacterized protein n=1 Tax=Oesophagostomum dentatum TaxID=61180 RepID=A0A0B1TG07_OESDE|nr:hypothetical protein OESDEN_05306 [Oesophagostomum dentatum]
MLPAVPDKAASLRDRLPVLRTKTEDQLHHKLFSSIFYKVMACGPTCMGFLIFMSIWGIIFLSILGGLYYNQSVGLFQNLPAEDKKCL